MSLILPAKKSALAADLRAQLGADTVKDDEPSLRAYAVDASIYRLTPQVITLPESEADIDVVVDYAVQQGIPRAADCTKAPRKLLASTPGMEFTEMRDADRCAGGGWDVCDQRL